MRPIYFLLLAFTLMLAGCYPDDFDKELWGPDPVLTFSSPGVTLQPSGGSETVTVTTNYDVWTAMVAEAGRAWCSVEQSGNTLTVTTTANPDEKERTTVISVGVGKGKKEIKEIAVTQLGTAPRIVADPPAVGLPMGGGSASVKITTNLTSWTPSVSVGSAWCNVVREGDRLTVSAGNYSGKQQREGLITVSGSGESGAAAVTTVKVIQLGSDPVLNVSDPGAFSSEGGRQSLVVMTNLADWEATVPSTASWCHAEKSGTTLTLQVDANGGSGGRRCEVLLTAGSGSGMLRRNIPVVQLGKMPELILSADSVMFDGDESVQSIGVFTDGTWTAETSDSWCTLLPGDRTLTVYAGKNPSTTARRYGKVDIRAGNLKQTLTIVQQPDITLVLSADTLLVEMEGGTQSLTVVTNQASWNVSVPDTVDWCSALPDGNQLTVTVGANTGAPRETVLTVTAGNGQDRKSVLLPLCQAGAVSDRDVLIAFYKATGGDNWTNNTNWCSDKPLSEWYGVTAETIQPRTKAGEAVERVTELHLGDSYGVGNNLTGTIPDVIGQLSELKILTLGFNQLSGAIPAALGNLTNLIELELYNNPFTGTLPPEIGNLTQLVFFRVGHAELEGGIPDSYRNLVNLKTFTVHECGLTGAFPDWLLNCNNLYSLSLAGNTFSGPLPAGLGELTGLTYLDLSYNQFSGSIPSEWGKLGNLKELFLNGNQLTGTIPAQLGNLSNLELLDLGNNQLSGSIPAELGNLTKLKQLYLYDNSLTGPIPPELGNLGYMVIFYLANNNLTGTIPDSFGKLSAVEFFTISNNRLSGVISKEAKMAHWANFNYEDIYPQQEGYGFSLENSEGSLDNFEDVEW